MMTAWTAWLPMLPLLSSAAAPACRPYCAAVACDSLNGDVRHECGGCGAGHRCRPGAPGFAGDRGPCAGLLHAPAAPAGRWGQSAHLYRSPGATGGAPVPPGDLDCADPAVWGSLEPDCADPEDVGRLAERGWVVLRGLSSRAELDGVSRGAAVGALCQPVLATTPEGRRACALSSAQFEGRLPALAASLAQLLAAWEAGGIAKGAEFGRRLRVATAHRSALSAGRGVRVGAPRRAVRGRASRRAGRARAPDPRARRPAC